MTLEETKEQMPNGFHDSEIEKFSYNPAAEILELEVLVWVGTMDDPPSLRERYRRGTICISGVDFFSMLPPLAKPLEWTILALEQEPYTPFETMYPVQREREQRLVSYKLWLGYSELSIAAEAFDFVWGTENEINRHSNNQD